MKAYIVESAELRKNLDNIKSAPDRRSFTPSSRETAMVSG